LEALPWKLSRSRKILVDLLESRRIRKGKTLNLCCGAGSNTVYLAQKGFQVTAINISQKAIEYAKTKPKKLEYKSNL
jgi:2-polyprenyl-3-methyl-5-hydroxy-6-metoxy-1,4-benzoquinol methylase